MHGISSRLTNINPFPVKPINEPSQGFGESGSSACFVHFANEGIYKSILSMRMKVIFHCAGHNDTSLPKLLLLSIFLKHVGANSVLSQN